MCISPLSMEALLDTPVQLPHDPDMWLKDTPYLVNEPAVRVVIEYLPGTKRRKVRQNGMEVVNVMPVAYGRISGTTDIHGEDLDMYINSFGYKPDAMVYIIDQVGLNGLFDEHKVMFGFASVQDAIAVYEGVVKPGVAPVKIGAITSMSQEEFAEWIVRPDKTKSPASFDTELGSIIVKKIQIYTKQSATPTVMSTQATPVPGGVEISLGNIQEGPYIVTKANGASGYLHECHVYGRITYCLWWKFLDQIVRLLDTATPDDKFKFMISSGGGCVPTVGPLLAAMENTQAQTETYAVGPVASAAVFIWAYGKTRIIRDNSYFMEHCTFQQISGKTPYLNALTAFSDKYARKIVSRLEAIGMFTPEEVHDMFDIGSDVFIKAPQMIERVGAVSGDGAKELINVN